MRRTVLSPVLAVAVVAGGLTAMTALSSSAVGGTKLYFHSANAGYQNDAANDPTAFVDGRAPAGSTLTTAAPTKTTVATARQLPPFADPGLPTNPTFALPGETGPITAVCIDIWAQNVPGAGTGQIDVGVSFVDGASGTITDADYLEVLTYPSGLVRVTGQVKVAGLAKLSKGSSVTIGGYIDADLGWSMNYDSVTNPSSITLNPTECKAAPVVVPSGSATPAPGGSGSATPGGSQSPTPAGTQSPSGTPTPTPSATPSATPTPSPTTQAPAQETGLEYTGATRGRYTDYATVSAKVTTSDDLPVPTGTVEFVLGSTRVTAPVGSNGVARTSLLVRNAPGAATMSVRYLANAAFNGSARQVPFTTDRMPTNCTITRTTTSSGWVITALLRDARLRRLGGQTILFAFNGRTHDAVRTNSKGLASWTAKPAHGTHTITFRTNPYYTGCSASLNV